MNRMMPALLEASFFTAVYLVALVASSPLRRRIGEETAEHGVQKSGFHGLLGCVALPVLVLVLTKLAALGIGLAPAGKALLERGAARLDAWQMFWMAVLAISLVEGVVLLAFRVRGKAFPLPDLLRNILRGVLMIAALFAVLRFQLGINIAPLLASTALLTAVIGFALQGVLGNLLAGMSLHVVRSVVPSDWVSIDGVEGEVIQTNWRETRLRTVAGHILVVPNSTVAAARIHNMTHPTPLRRHAIAVGASYSDAPGDVAAALVESALAVPAVLREPEPSAYVTEYKDFGINYSLRFWSNRYYDRTALEGDVMRMIWYQFKRRGIEIPFPMSDKLLNDFMEVVYRQRTMPPEEIDVQRTVDDLLKSDFAARLLVDEKGGPLLKKDDLQGVARRVRRVRYTAGEVVFRQGDPGESCYVVVAGRVRGRVEYQDAAQANEFELGPGALFGEMSLVTGLPRTASIAAGGEVELLEISGPAFVQMLGLRADIPAVLANLASERAHQNAAALEKLKAMGSANVGEIIRRENILGRFLRMLGRK